ncbi:dehydratase (plasmid) [Amycolatopsis sp. AA4]|uniref:MaoC family dehydratase n=1 Tax=Actinomycetes TaxID=1760 RepID=UPI0001B566E6|nr:MULTISPECIES: MaoC family dehydratase [Actinomycetes]ATY17177.1 dehydratase [Amycolatopsis sp. AA4]EFL12587.1 dehydratase [Streptomyces sp. AA4]
MTVKTGWRGRFYEDFEVGDVYQHPLGRTVTETDNTWFTLLTMNTAQIHFNNAAGEASEFGRCLVNSTLTLAIVAGQSVIDTSFNAIANLGWEDIKLTRPVFAGDTLYSETTVLNKRESRSRPHAGLVQVTTRGLNQDGEQVLSYTRTFLVHKRGHTAPAAFPAAKTPFTAPEASLA